MAKIPFNVSAKTARLIGRENVSNLEGALIELIKNTYDADATKCIIYFEQSTNTLFIIDNGTGMSKNTIIENWMTIGNSSKLDNLLTASGRVNTGEKGIGRFALDRISSKCKMYTNNGKSKFYWEVNWDSFEENNLITETYAVLYSTEEQLLDCCKIIKNTKLLKLFENNFKTTGTCFILTNLRDNWNQTILDRINNNLKKLLPPTDNKHFELYLFTENNSINDAKIKPLFINDFDYKIIFSVNDNNFVKIKLYRNEFYFGSEFDSIIRKGNFSNEDREYFNGTPIVIDTNINELLPGIKEYTIGSFSGEIIFNKLKIQEINKEKYFYKDFISNRSNFKEISGIKIYRDNFLVRPYGIFGTTGYDWLDLSGRKSDSPAAAKSDGWRVDSNQICGEINISRLNKTLPDKSSREGIVETKDFILFKELIISIIDKIEKDRQYVISRLDKIYENTVQGERALQLAKDHIKNTENKKNNKETRISDMQFETFKKAINYQETQIHDLEEEMGLLRTLATTGIVVNTYIHEIKSLTTLLNTGIKDSIKLLQKDKDIDKTVEKLNELRILRTRFSSWFKVTLDSVQLDKRSRKKIDIINLLNNIIKNWNNVFEKDKIQCLLKTDISIVIRCFPFDFETIINNLITNSYSKFDLSNKNENLINLSLTKKDEYFCLHYEDTGPGLDTSFKNKPEQILKYGITDKRNKNGEKIGTGVGLWIVNNIVQSYNGFIDLSQNLKETKGFYIDIYFKGRED